MPDARSRIRELASSQWPDGALAAALTAALLAYELAARPLDRRDSTIPVVILLCCGAVAGRRRMPLAAAAVTSAALLLAWAFGQASLLDGPLTLLIVAPPLVAYTLGSDERVATGLAGVALMSLALQSTGGSFNPLFEMITVGPWLAGRFVASQRRIALQIETRNRELAAERSLYALESVRYERARIARDLHDIVAHCVSVIVVQAGAGQRLVVTSPEGVAEALDAIVEATEQADTELQVLAGRLGGREAPTRSAGLRLIDELAERAAATGITVRYTPSAGTRELDPPASDVAYRVVQESLTNALKHAAGASIEIAIRETADQIEVEVTTAASVGHESGLERTGAGRGLSGMRERVAGCGGTFKAGPTPAGGWRVSALLPAAPYPEPACSPAAHPATQPV
jgi:signal transduction histidine kinase